MSRAFHALTDGRFLALAAAGVMAACDGQNPSAPSSNSELAIQPLSAVTLSGVVGEMAAPAPWVRVVDARGNPRAFERIEFVTTEGLGVIAADTLTNANGEAHAAWLFSSRAGYYGLLVFVNSRKTFLRFDADVRAGPATRIIPYDYGHIDGVAFARESTGNPGVIVSDAFGNYMENTVDVLFVVTDGGGQLVGGTDSLRVGTQIIGFTSVAQLPLGWKLGGPGLNRLAARLNSGAAVTFEVMALDSANVTWYVSPQGTQTPLQKLALSNNGYFIQESSFSNLTRSRFVGTYNSNGATLTLSGCTTGFFDVGDQVCSTMFGQVNNDLIVLGGRTYTRQ